MGRSSAVCMASFCDASGSRCGKATLANTTTADHPNTTANAVPRLTLLMHVMPIAVSTNVQMVMTSNGVSRA